MNVIGKVFSSAIYQLGSGALVISRCPARNNCLSGRSMLLKLSDEAQKALLQNHDTSRSWSRPAGD